MLGRLDEDIRIVRRRLEERHHLRNCMREAVNDIRRYRRRVKVAEKEAAQAPVDAIAERFALLRPPIEEAVLDQILTARDELRAQVEREVGLEARWAELIAERERRLAPLPAPLLDRLGEVEERQGVLSAQMLVAERVSDAGETARATLRILRECLEQPGEPDPLLQRAATAQALLLTFRREVKTLETATARVEAELAALLGFTDSLQIGRAHV